MIAKAKDQNKEGGASALQACILPLSLRRALAHGYLAAEAGIIPLALMQR